MLAWLSLHGLDERTHRAEILEWEEWFAFIGACRAKVQEELMPTTSANPDTNDEDLDR